MFPLFFNPICIWCQTWYVLSGTVIDGIFVDGAVGWFDSDNVGYLVGENIGVIQCVIYDWIVVSYKTHNIFVYKNCII